MADIYDEQDYPVARQRRMAEALLAEGMNYSPVQSVWQGVARLADGLVGGLQMRSANAQEKAGQDAFTAALTKGAQGGDLATTGANLAATPYGRSAGREMLLTAMENRIPTQTIKTLKNAAGGEGLYDIETVTGQTPKVTPLNVQGDSGSGVGPTTLGEKALDQKYAADLQQWGGGGYSEAMSSISSLDIAINDLKTKKNISGPTIGYAVRQPRDSALGAIAAYKYPDAFDVSERHKRAVAASLKNILGSRPAESVINSITTSTYDPSLPQETNISRLENLRDNLVRMAKSKQGAAEYFTKHGTLAGYAGKVPDIGDLLSEGSSAAPAAPPPAPSAPAGAPSAGLPGDKPIHGATKLNVGPGARPIPTADMIAALKKHANDPEARKTFDEFYGQGAADHFLRGGM